MADDDRSKKYRKTPPFGSRDLAAPHEVEPETTGVHSRLRRLSAQQDAMAQRMTGVEKEVSEVKAVVAGVDGKVDGLVIAVGAVQTSFATTNTHIRADIEVTKARAITETEDKADARKTRRRVIAKLLTAAIGGTGFVATITALIVKGC